MNLQDENVETLMNLGLTNVQARVYLSIANSKKATVQTISEESKVARPDVYRTIVALEKKGLVEKTIAAPKEYRCTSITEGISTLLNIRIEHTSALQEKTSELLRFFQASILETEREKESQFVMFLEKGDGHLRIPRAVAKAQVSVSAISTSQIVSNRVANFEQYLKTAVSKGVIIRNIIDKADNEKPEPKPIQALKKTGFFDIRYRPTVPPASFVLIDDKEVFFRSSQNLGVPILWSDNPFLVATLKDYFETMWISLKNQKEC